MQQNSYVLTISCPDRVGIVAKVSSFLAENNCMIAEANHHADRYTGQFFMRNEITDIQMDEAAFREAFAKIADEFDMKWQLSASERKKRVLIMVSKQDHCLADLLYRWSSGEIDCEIPCVISNHLDMKGLVEWYGIPYLHIPVTPENKPQVFDEVVNWVDHYQADTIVLARYMQIIPPALCQKYPGQIINIHHSFLPSFIGAKPYHQAYERGVKLIGATCHYVTEDLDAGPIIEQDVARVSHSESAEEMVVMGKDVEKNVLARGLKYHLQDRVLIYGNKTVVFAQETGMPLRLMKYAWKKSEDEPRFFPEEKPLKKAYDVVIIGGGGHGMACAYYLAKEHGITNVAVLEQGYIGGGNTGRNTTIVRSNYLTSEGVKFYDESLKLFEDLSDDFDLNIFYSTRGHFTLAHTDSAMRTMRWRAEVNKHHGIDSEVVDVDTIKKEVPYMDMSCNGQHPVMGALYHAPGSVARHDAVAWGYARGAQMRGVEIHQKTQVTDIKTQGGKVVGVETDKGFVEAKKVISMVAGSTPRITEMLDIKTPIEIFPLQACVTEPVKPFMDTIVVSGSLHVYVSQSSRGELVMGASVDPAELHSTRSTLDFVEGLTDQMMDLFPFTSRLKIMRQWAGMSDITPDFAPIMGKTDVEGFYLDAGWGTWGFKATPVSGKTMAHTVATDSTHELIKPFSLDRYAKFELVGEKGAASVGH